MAKTETTAARSPRGTKPVAQAFFTALETIPEAGRAAVAKAAQAMIRDQIKMQRDKSKLAAAKAKAASAKDKARTPAVEEPVATKAGAKAKTTSAAKSLPAKRRAGKPAELPKAA